MALLSLTIPNMLNGVSQQPDQLRFPNQGDIQENGYSSVVDGLAKRYPTEHVARVVTGAVGPCKVHTIVRDDAERYVVVVTDNEIRVFDENGVAQTVTYATGARDYINLDTGQDPSKVFKLCTVADYTFIVNTSKTVAMDTATTAALTEQSLIWVQQGAYSTKYAVAGTPSGSHTTGAGNNQVTATVDGESFTSVSEADTTYIAAKLSTALTLPTGATKSRSGYAIRIAKGTASSIVMSVTDGVGGGGLKLVTKSVPSMESLPELAPKGFKTEIVGSESGSEDNYWVEFDNDQASAGDFGKGSWAETVAPGVAYKLNASTMPHVLVRTSVNSTTGIATFELQKGTWADREVGDTTSNPDPSFVGEKINQVFLFRGRLGLLAGESVVLSESAEYFNFWRTTVTAVLDSDPIDVTSGYPAVTTLRHAIPFDDRLVIFSDRVQFVLTAPNVLTPSSVLMNVVGSYESLPGAAPILVGEQIYYGFDRGGHSGVRQVVANAEDTALLLSPDISANVPKYIKGKVTELVGSSHDNIVVAMTDYDPSVLYVYKWLDIGRDRAQSSWSSWTFTGAFVRGASWIESTLYLVIERPQGLFLEKMTVEPNRADPQSKFVAALDRRTVPTSKTYNATTNQTTLNLPYNVHNSARMRAVTQAVEQSQDYDFGANWSQPALDLDGNSANIDLNFLVSTREGGYLFRVVSASGSTMVISGNAMDRPVWVGETYDFRYRFSIPYLRQDQERTGTSITTGRLQLRNMSVRYANSAYFKATVTQRFGGGSYESLYTGNLLGTGQSIIHGITIDSGSFRIPILARNDEAVIELTSDSHLPCAFVGAEIEATYDARTQRV
jgi:hypothetical protein